MTQAPPLRLKLENVSKRYGEHNVQAVFNVSLSVKAGEFVALMGPSGCGKSTLLNLIAGIDQPDEGNVLLDGRNIANLDDARRTSIRGEQIGFVFQFFNLLTTLSVEENILLPLRLAGKTGTKEMRQVLERLLASLGLSERAAFFPPQLSGGEMQRVAIARAIIHSPSLVLADEPTGNLDTTNGETVLQLLRQLCREHEHTIVMATHSSEAAQAADRTITMKDGHLLSGDS